jgi:hypothetical protein
MEPSMGRSFIASGRRLALACLVLAGGCVASQQTDFQLDSSTPVPDAGAPSMDASVACSIPALGSPATIADAIALTNALLARRAPVTIDCFLSALNQPLTVLGVVSTFSLQPSVGGTLNPRVFIFSGNLVMSVVPAGEGSPYVELAEYTSPVRSLKAQLEFPVTVPVTAPDVYDSIRRGEGTSCGVCHSREQPAPEITSAEAFESDVLAPVPTDVVPLQRMQDDRASCDPQVEPDRCAMLNALFSHPVITGAFSPDARTIFE